MSYVEVCQKHGQYHGEICGDCYEGLKEENIRLREALEWMVANQHLTIMIEEPEHVEHFMSRARAALGEGKE